jgi:hypothetical protein
VPGAVHHPATTQEAGATRSRTRPSTRSSGRSRWRSLTEPGQRGSSGRRCSCRAGSSSSSRQRRRQRGQGQRVQAPAAQQQGWSAAFKAARGVPVSAGGSSCGGCGSSGSGAGSAVEHAGARVRCGHGSSSGVGRSISCSKGCGCCVRPNEVITSIMYCRPAGDRWPRAQCTVQCMQAALSAVQLHSRVQLELCAWYQCNRR